jgi:alkylation response protein AidB-like acyl-CoA dehydrogenase
MYGRPAARRLMTSSLSRNALAAFLNRTTTDAAITRSFGLSSLAKARGGDVAMSVTQDALEIAGLTDAPVRGELEKLWRDAKLCQIYEGTNQLNRIEVYKALVAGATMPALPPRRRRVDPAGVPV